MKQYFTRFAIIAILAAIAPAVVHAQAARNWVSGVGADANPGSRTFPCKTFPAALAITAAGGEVDALDPGSYAAATITKAITIDGGGGQVAAILASGTNGFTINAGVNDTVIIRNIRFLGSGTPNAGLSGINIVQAGTVIIQDCEIDNFSVDGIHVETTAPLNLSISNTRIINCANDGVFAHSTAALRLSVSHSETQRCHYGFEIRSGTATISDTISSNGGAGFLANNGAIVHCTRCVASGSSSGVDSVGSSIISINDCDFSGNINGIYHGGGNVLTAGNNRFVGNGTDGATTGLVTIH